MTDATVAFPFFTIPIYSLALVLGITLSLGLALRRAALRLSVLIDTGLGACLGGVIGARIVHVLLNWAYFADNLSEALRPSAGGLDWHGAVIGGLIGLGIVSIWRRLNLRMLLDALSPALPLLAFVGWLGCWAAVCAYGAEVDTLAHYPAFVAAETRDVFGIVAPRYNTQVFGMALALVLLIVSVVLIRQGWLTNRRFWILLALLSAGMFGIGFFRGDYAIMVAGLRADQVLDGSFFLWSILVMILSPRAQT
jgi:phosphatidylglycerol:prolipoprotein diacylglycerol transferase